MQDPGFVQQCATTWTQMRSGEWSDSSVTAALNSVQASILPAGLRDFARCSNFSLKRLLWVPRQMSLQGIVLAQRDHCSQNAVIGSQSHCPYIKNVLALDILTKKSYCTVAVLQLLLLH